MSTVERAGSMTGPMAPDESEYPIVKIAEGWVGVLWGPREQWAMVYPHGIDYRLSEPRDQGEQIESPDPNETPPGYPTVPPSPPVVPPVVRGGYL